MKFSEAANLISRLRKETSVLLLGAPGLGKSSLAYEIGKLDKTDNIYCCDLGCHLPEDLLGLPYRKDGYTTYDPPEWLNRFKSGPGVLIFDDLAVADQRVQTAVFRLVQERATSTFTLSKETRIIATANRREDKSGASVLPAALRNRMLILTLDADIFEWSSWARSNGVYAPLIDFLNFKPSLLSTYPKDADTIGAFATPRSWANLGKELVHIGEQSLKLSSELYSGFVGSGPAGEFRTYLKVLRDFPDPRGILMDPEGKLPHPPKEPDILISLVSTLGLMAASLRSEDPKIQFKLLKALAYVTEHNNEYSIAGISTYISNGGVHDELASSSKELKDPRIQKLLKHLSRSKPVKDDEF
jgi:AAA domain (dynein-related subfamily)